MTLDEIEEYKEVVLQIMFDIQVSVNNAKMIGTNSTEDEDWVKGHSFFKHYFLQLRFITVIQLAKLLSDSGNQKYNFHKFLRRLESEKHPFIDFNEGQESTFIRNKITSGVLLLQLTSGIKSSMEKYKDDIEVLVTLRDKVYAHKDQYQINKILPWERIESLSKLVFEIYNKISGAFFDAEFFFPNKSGWSPEWVIKQAAKTRLKR
jgi:hypothetical protein